MMQTLFENLKKAKLIKRNQLKLNELEKMSFSNTLDLIDGISVATAEFSKTVKLSPYSHSASLSLGGGRQGCYSIKCRKNKLDETARFAALYSDQVFIHNFISTYSPTFGHPPEEDSEYFRAAVRDDLNLLFAIQPLIESGSITLYTPPTNQCPICLAEKVFGLETGKRIKATRNLVAQQILDKLSVEISYHEEDSDSYQTCNIGLEDIYGHRLYQHSAEIPEIIKDNKEIIQQLHRGKKVILTKEYLKNFNYAKQIASKLLRNCTYHLSVSSVFDTMAVTDRDIDIDILSHITDNEHIERRNRITSEHLKAIVPFAGDVPVSRLLTLRQRENDSFVQFRSALGKSINEVSKQKGDFTVQDARTLYADIIAPEISRLEKKVDEAKRDLVIKPLSSAIGTVAVIGFGAYAGMIPSELSELATLLGLTKTIYDTASKVTELLDVQKGIRPEEYYYLWKVKHSS